jgi:hypothetical protein
MRKTTFLLSVAATVAMVAGCVVSDQITTITVQPDGSADWVKFQSNIRSTEKGAKGAEELRRFVEAFDTHQGSDSARITQSGGEVLEARWLRNGEPYANVLTARFPNWNALEKFCTITDEKGNVIIRPQFTQNGNRRKLSLVIPVPKQEKPPENAEPTVARIRQDQANGISASRIVVTGGRIVASQGFTVASDKRSALLNPAEIQELFQPDRKLVEVFLEWELTSEREAAISLK